MPENKKGKKVGELKQVNMSNSLEPAKGLESYAKKPGQVGIHAPESLDSVRRRKPEERVDTGERVFAGVSAPQVSPQTYDCYKPVKKSEPKKKK